MTFRTALIIAMLFLTTLFAALNWAAFNEPATLNLVFFRAEIPLGVLMLTLLCASSVLFLLFVARAETATLLENRRILKELDQARKLADSSEESRFKELREQLDERLGRIDEMLGALSGRTGSGDAEDAAPANGHDLALEAS